MVKIVDDNEATARIEAALYSAGRPLSIEDIIKASGTESRRKTLPLLSNIMKKTKSAFRAIEVVTLPDGSYVFQLKPEYSATIRKYASKPILTKSYSERHYLTLHTCNQSLQNNLLKQEVQVFIHILKN